MEQERKNWVEERARCNMSLLFDSVCRLVQEDTKQADTHARMNFQCDRQGDKLLVRALEFGLQIKACVFENHAEKKRIQVSVFRGQDRERTYDLSTRWDAEKGKCRVVSSVFRMKMHWSSLTSICGRSSSTS